MAEVLEWTQGAENAGVPVHVKFSWRLTAVPSWAKRPEFKSIPVMAAPVTEMTILKKTNKGWRPLFDRDLAL